VNEENEEMVVGQNTGGAANFPLISHGPITGGNGPYANPKPYPEPVDYTTWANVDAVSIQIKNVDVKEALLALDLLRTRSPEYEGLTISHASSISLISKLFKAEFGTEMPPVPMAIAMGAKIRSRDAECVLSVIRDVQCPF
jgi:hypothetical protein